MPALMYYRGPVVLADFEIIPIQAVRSQNDLKIHQNDGTPDVFLKYFRSLKRRMSSPSILLSRNRPSRSLSVRIRSRLKKTFPIVEMMRSGYSVGDVFSDALAGLAIAFLIKITQRFFKTFSYKVEIICRFSF